MTKSRLFMYVSLAIGIVFVFYASLYALPQIPVDKPMIWKLLKAVVVSALAQILLRLPFLKEDWPEILKIGFWQAVCLAFAYIFLVTPA